MTRDGVLEMVARHIRETSEDLAGAAIDPARSMRDYGLGSLDMVEVVSRSTFELGVDAPVPALRKLKTIGELVDLLHGLAEQGPER